MKLKVILFSCLLIVLSSCSSNDSEVSLKNNDEYKKYVIDFLQSKEGRETIVELIQDPEIEQAMIDLLKSTEIHEQMKETALEIFESPSVQQYIQDILSNTVETKKSKSNQDSKDGSSQTETGGNKEQSSPDEGESEQGTS